jgi:peptide/nickel transport system substrate-binding protein
VRPREHVERLTRDPQLYVLRVKDTQRISTAVNQKNPIFKDVRVRQAVLGYGIDRPAITKTALLGQAQPLWSFMPPGSRGQIDFEEQFPYDPEKARALLKEAGYDQPRGHTRGRLDRPHAGGLDGRSLSPGGVRL